jgi:hypothetical protein
MPTIDLPADELAAVTAARRRVIDGDRYPHAPRLDPLRAALARLEAAAGHEGNTCGRSATLVTDQRQVKPAAKAPPPAKADKRARR